MFEPKCVILLSIIYDIPLHKETFEVIGYGEMGN